MGRGEAHRRLVVERDAQRRGRSSKPCGEPDAIHGEVLGRRARVARIRRVREVEPAATIRGQSQVLAGRRRPVIQDVRAIWLRHGDVAS